MVPIGRGEDPCVNLVALFEYGAVNGWMRAVRARRNTCTTLPDRELAK
jgi:hypothetical protein